MSIDDRWYRTKGSVCLLQRSLHFCVCSTILFVFTYNADFCRNPADTTLIPVSRTVGSDRVVGPSPLYITFGSTRS